MERQGKAEIIPQSGLELRGRAARELPSIYHNDSKSLFGENIENYPYTEQGSKGVLAIRYKGIKSEQH